MSGASSPAPGRRSVLESAELLRRWQDQDDVAALDQLLRAEVAVLRERVRHRYPNLLRPSAGASDVAQEAAAAMLRAQPAPRFDTPAALRAYLLVAAWRLLLRRRPAGRPVLRLDPSGGEALAASRGSSASAAADAERAIQVQLAVNLLPAEEREILDLVYFRGLPIVEAGKQLGLHEEAAKARARRARLALARRLQAWQEAVA